VLAVARLIEPKGLVYLLEACALLRERGLRFVCEIVGGPELPLYVNDYLEIRSTHARLGLDGCVELVGALPFAEVRKRYERADVFAIPFVKGRDGSNDIIPNAVLEAMACGLPVVTTNITALPELVTDGESGFLVPPRDTEALAARIAELIESPYLRARMGSYGRRRAEERFDIERNVMAYVELFASS
jgi:colanic acid/amylovoran biosynthesis glycosyltransferase